MTGEVCEVKVLPLPLPSLPTCASATHLVLTHPLSDPGPHPTLLWELHSVLHWGDVGLGRLGLFWKAGTPSYSYVSVPNAPTLPCLVC